ncbi:MAG: hypothetical protein FD129_1089 [bacterium]|nr:MAG: hypothetical protein FD129_1089 [bacterium]
MTTYIDASVLLRIVLGQPEPLGEWPRLEAGLTSAITRVECLRTLDRERQSGRLAERGVALARASLFSHLDALSIIELGEGILERASNPFPTSLGTLDALHLASALQWRDGRREPIRLATHDRQLALCARAVGLEVIGLAD